MKSLIKHSLSLLGVVMFSGTSSAFAALTAEEVKTVETTPSHNCVHEDTNKTANTTGCFVVGALAIPFRYELSGKKDVLGGISADMFFGFNVYQGLTPFVYLGYLPTFSATNGSTSGGSGSSALDVGFGFTFPVLNIDTGQQAHVGFVAGTDIAGSSANYAYNGKLYLSLMLGVNFGGGSKGQ